MQKPFTKTGIEVIGTYENIPGCALVAGREDDGELVYDGETKMYWDGQKTQQANGENIWIDANGDEVLESELVWKEEESESHCRYCGQSECNAETCTHDRDGVIKPRGGKNL